MKKNLQAALVLAIIAAGNIFVVTNANSQADLKTSKGTKAAQISSDDEVTETPPVGRRSRRAAPEETTPEAIPEAKKPGAKALRMLEENECSTITARSEGIKAAKEEGRLKWGAIGFCSSCIFCGTPGCLGATGAAYIISDANDANPAGSCMMNDKYVASYKGGYESEIKTRNAVSAFGGGAIAAAAIIAAWVVLIVL